jgi:hypothetical protein
VLRFRGCRISGTALLTMAFAGVFAQAAPFTYSGVGRAADLAAIAGRYPHSSLSGEYIHIAPADVRDLITGVALSGTGTARRLRITFEVSASGKPPAYPECAQIQPGLQKRYGPPDITREFDEEAARRSDRVWRTSSEEMTLVCFHPPRHSGPWLAEALIVAVATN